MWEPDPSWERLRSGGGASTLGVWAAQEDGRRWIVKRLGLPDDPVLADPHHAGYWRREAEVAAHAEIFTGPGLLLPQVHRIEEDPEGVAIWTADVPGEPPGNLFAARALGRFAVARTPDEPWAGTAILAGRLAMAEERGGWPTLARTTLADVADVLWRRRRGWLQRLAEGPQGQVHGDVTPGNLLAVRGDDVVAVDWQCYGHGPVGADLGYFSLSCREDFDVLLDAFLTDVDVDAEAVATAARVTAVYTVFSRAEWALAMAAKGEGALAGKYRHPSVAPHLLALQRQLTNIEALLQPT